MGVITSVSDIMRAYYNPTANLHIFPDTDHHRQKNNYRTRLITHLHFLRFLHHDWKSPARPIGRAFLCHPAQGLHNRHPWKQICRPTRQWDGISYQPIKHYVLSFDAAKVQKKYNIGDHFFFIDNKQLITSYNKFPKRPKSILKFRLSFTHLSKYSP